MSQQFNASPDNLTLAVDYTCRLRKQAFIPTTGLLVKWRFFNKQTGATVVK
jgi:hypothetical protein